MIILKLLVTDIFITSILLILSKKFEMEIGNNGDLVNSLNNYMWYRVLMGIIGFFTATIGILVLAAIIEMWLI